MARTGQPRVLLTALEGSSLQAKRIELVINVALPIEELTVSGLAEGQTLLRLCTARHGVDGAEIGYDDDPGLMPPMTQR